MNLSPIDGLDSSLLSIDTTPKNKKGEGAGNFAAKLDEQMQQKESAHAADSREADEPREADAADGKELRDDNSDRERDESSQQEADNEEEESAEKESGLREGGNVLPFVIASLPQQARHGGGAEEGTAESPKLNTTSAAMASQLQSGGEATDREQTTQLSTQQRSMELDSGLKPSAGAVKEALQSKFGEAAGSGEPLNKATIVQQPQTAVSAPGQQALQPNQGTTNTQLPQFQVNVPVQQRGWEQAMGERVVWMARQNLQEAQLQLNPRQLGHIEVHLNLSQDQASVSFVAQNPQTREALEASLPRLREMFGEQGLNLAQADVSSRDGSEQQRQTAGEERSSRGFATNGMDDGMGTEGTGETGSYRLGYMPRSQVDYFA